MRGADPQREALLAPGIGRIYNDKCSVPLAKWAVPTGKEMPLEFAALEAGDVETFVVSAAAGVYIDVRGATAIGFVLDLAPERLAQV